MNVQTSFYSGTSNVVSPIKQTEYPVAFTGASRLTYYASMFSSVEINSTFYKLPKAATVEKWGNSVPEDFRFTFKVPKGVTHSKDLRFNAGELELFVETVARVRSKTGCLLVQLPPKVSRDKEEELSLLLECLNDFARGWKIAVEFRHPSWYDSAVYRLLNGYGAVMVEHDLPKSATPKIEVAASFMYLRFHGPDGTYRGSYDNAILNQHAKRVTNCIKAGQEVYAYFNNTMGNAFGNLQELNRMVNTLLF